MIRCLDCPDTRPKAIVQRLMGHERPWWAPWTLREKVEGAILACQSCPCVFALDYRSGTFRRHPLSLPLISQREAVKYQQRTDDAKPFENPPPVSLLTPRERKAGV